jgi:two-component system chemotaxis response regulator CheY
MRRMIRRTLELTGLPLGIVHEAGDGARALELFGHNHIDLALIDINMPVMDGATLITRLRAEPCGAALPILVISTESSRTRVAELEQLGARFVHKPFTPEQLSTAIRDLIGADDGPGSLEPARPCGDSDF